MPTRPQHGPCALCGRVCRLTFHHLIPKKLHRRAFFRKTYTRDDLNRGIDICRACHDGLHDHYDEMTLARRFASLEALQADPDIRKHTAWAARQRSGH